VRILDLRPRLARSWQASAGRARHGNRVARLWTRGVDGFLARRAARRGSPPAGLRVVAVGNLALGGTGKTPVSMALARDLAARGERGVVLTRGYGSHMRGPLVVEPERQEAGDEARLMARELAATGWRVVQARDRVAGLSWVARHEPDLRTVILEDGFQNTAARHLDVLILDRWSVVTTGDGEMLVPDAGPVAPWGTWRESVRGVARADVLLVESATPPSCAAGGQPVAGFARELHLEGDLSTGAPWIALSGIARPEPFEDGVTASLGREPDLAIRCRDHADYTGRLGGRLAAAVRAAGSLPTVTTAKDWIKLRTVWPADLPVVVARQELVWTGKKALPALVGERLDACLE